MYRSSLAWVWITRCTLAIGAGAVMLACQGPLSAAHLPVTQQKKSVKPYHGYDLLPPDVPDLALAPVA